MVLLSTIALLLLAFSRVAVSQCEYIYVAEPPSGQLICDPYPINQLQLVCSIFVTDINLPDTLMIQWYFSVPDNRQFNPANVTLLQEVEFDIALIRETYTSRIVVSSPPGGFYFCQPLLLTSSTPLIRSNVAPLQPPSFYQDHGIRPCLVSEFQNTTSPFCAQQGVTLGPDQIIDPAPTIIETVQTISASLDAMPTQSNLLVIEKTPTPSNTLSDSTNTAAPSDPEDDSENRVVPARNDQTLPGIIAGVVLVVLSVTIFTIILSVVIAAVRLKTWQCRKVCVTAANQYLESSERFDDKSSEEVTSHDHGGERTYDYPKSDPEGNKIPVSPNEAYATSIVIRKNEAYESVSTSGTVDEYYVYEYI